MPRERKRLYRSDSDRMLTGVLGGLADYFGLEPSLLRIVYVVLTALTGFVPGLVTYVVMAIIVPLAPEADGGDDAAQK